MEKSKLEQLREKQSSTVSAAEPKPESAPTQPQKSVLEQMQERAASVQQQPEPEQQQQQQPIAWPARCPTCHGKGYVLKTTGE